MRPPALARSNVLITPHVGGSSTAFEPRAKRLLARQLGLFAAA